MKKSIILSVIVTLLLTPTIVLARGVTVVVMADTVGMVVTMVAVTHQKFHARQHQFSS